MVQLRVVLLLSLIFFRSDRSNQPERLWWSQRRGQPQSTATRQDQARRHHFSGEPQHRQPVPRLCADQPRRGHRQQRTNLHRTDGPADAGVAGDSLRYGAQSQVVPRRLEQRRDERSGSGCCLLPGRRFGLRAAQPGVSIRKPVGGPALLHAGGDLHVADRMFQTNQGPSFQRTSTLFGNVGDRGRKANSMLREMCSTEVTSPDVPRPGCAGEDHRHDRSQSGHERHPDHVSML